MHETTRSQGGARRTRRGPGGAGAGVLVPDGEGLVRARDALATVRIAGTGRAAWVDPAGGDESAAIAGRPLEALGEVIEQGRRGQLPGSGWAGFLGYALGGMIEPRTGVASVGSLPLGEWHRVGAGAAQPVESRSGSSPGTVRSVQGRARYTAAVERTLGYIRGGDIYQANVAHQLRGRVSGSAVALYAALARGARPQHGMGLVGAPLGAGAGYAVLSLSPELFLSFDAPTRRLVTRPMKGTRPGDGDALELCEAEKDRAELTMIVDLMRNDLGRVCEFGSVRVDAAREIERHGAGPGAVLQATATVSGVVCAGAGIGQILAATFPPGSVTGAPKVRAMQVIAELEGFARGPYCGCIGTIEDDGSFELAVSIRTAVVRGPVDAATGEFVDAECTYCVGAGIVADSEPQREWEETLTKAGALAGVLAFDARPG